MKRLARDRTAFRQWTEDPTLQGNRDGWRWRTKKDICPWRSYQTEGVPIYVSCLN
jgi:hypothetical protein